MKERILYKLNSLIISLLFCVAIFVPFSMGMIEKDKNISQVERRKLSKFPETPKSLKEIKEFPELLTTYYSDHFGLRERFIEYYRFCKYKLGDSPSQDVTLGKDGWLFLGSSKKGYTKFNDPIGDARNANLYSQEALEQVAFYMKGINTFLKKQGIKYIFFIAPNKHSIYFDQMPDYIKKVNDTSATDQLINYLTEHTDVTIMDFRPLLMKEKVKQAIYNKAGTHWNQYAANIVQFELLSHIQKHFPGKIVPKLYDSSLFVNKTATDRDLEGLLGFKLNPPLVEPYIVFTAGEKPVSFYPQDPNGKFFRKKTYTHINLSQQLNTIIFKDSFFVMLEAYIHKHFRHSTFIWKKPNYQLLSKYIKKEKPDLIIEEWVERSLPFIPKPIQEINGAYNKKRFSKSDDLIFSNNWNALKLSQNFKISDKKNNDLNLFAIGNDPSIKFPQLPFEIKSSYILQLQFNSSVESTLQLFYSNSHHLEAVFSEKNSVRFAIKKGDNELYISLEYPNTGKYLRLDPISKKGEVIIKSLNIKKVKK